MQPMNVFDFDRIDESKRNVEVGSVRVELPLMTDSIVGQAQFALERVANVLVKLAVQFWNGRLTQTLVLVYRFAEGIQFGPEDVFHLVRKENRQVSEHTKHKQTDEI